MTEDPELIAGGDNAAAVKKAAAAKKVAVEKIYQKKTQLEHILLRPDTYIGSVERVEQETWIWDMETERMVKKNIKYVPGLFKIFDEILVNAADNKIRDSGQTMIKVTINKEENKIKVWNDGKGIPVVEHKHEKVFVPTLIFGHLLTSSNYNDEEKKVTGGRNGYGAKLCNIFSTKFVVETSCKENKKYFKQTWQNNMGKTGEPVIKPNQDKDFTCVTFYPDLAKFGMTELEDDLISLLARRAYDVAASTRGVKVYLNDKRLPINKFEDYCKLFVANNEGGGDNDILNSSNQAATKIMHEKVNERWEVAVAYSDIGFQSMSFVNSIATTKGGRHVDYVCDQIVKSLGEVINKKSGKNSTQVKPFQIKNHLWLFVNCLIENPVFESQTKECMTLQVKNFGSKCQLSEDFLKKVASKSGIVDRVLNWLAFKEKTDLEKTGPKSKQSKLKGIPKLDDANNAGTRDSINCTLILTEGDSAKTLAVAGLGVIGRDRYGVFPLRGKMLNVREATPKQILDNAEVTSICKIVGLNFKEKYESKESMKQLRYGKIMIMTDQDHDGSHIKGLIINFIHYQWPNLLRHGFVEEFITPIIKVFRTKKDGQQQQQEKSFFSVPEFEEWQKHTPDWNTWKIKYYKGLGTSTSKEAKEYFSDMSRHCIRFVYSGVKDDLSIQLAFNKRLAEERKEWLTKFMEKRIEGTNKYLYQKDTKAINFSQFVNKELILFSNLDNERSIPSLVDGFKPGQRKVLFACFKRNLTKEIKVAQLAGSVAELSAYHHGEQSLMSTIINLAQNFVGSNNLNLLQPIGQFGTRLHGGKDAASPRYIFTNLSPLTRLLFNVKDDPLFDYINDDGLMVEPEHYCPILPMVLVNGAEGIGTGWAVKIPNFNVRDIIENLKRMINKEEPVSMKPYYKNFRGTIDRLDDQRFLVSGEVSLIQDPESDDEGGGGGRKKNDFYMVEISELPVGVWTQAYKESVLEAYLQGTVGGAGGEGTAQQGGGGGARASQTSVPLIAEYKEYHTDCTVRFLVKMTSKQYHTAMNQGGLHKFFKLQKTVSLNNMVLFDSKGCIKRYETPLEILNEFYKIRYGYYEKRKDYLERMLGAEARKLDNIARFIVEKIEGKIKVENMKKEALVKMLAENGYDSDPVRQWRDKLTKEKGYFHDASTTPAGGGDSNQDEDAAESSKYDYNYLLSMPIWNLTLEKKEEILKQQKHKNAELKSIKAKTIEQLWLEDITEFADALDKYELKEKEEMEMFIKKNVKQSQKGAATATQKNLKNEYLPDPIGQRVEPKVDQQMLTKVEKEAQQKVLTKAKKEESLKGLSLVDVILDEKRLNEEEERQVKEMAVNLANPNKAKAATTATTKKEKKEKEGGGGDVNGEVNGESTKEGAGKPSKAKKEAASSDGVKKEKKEKEKEKITIDTDSEESFDEVISKPSEENIERRQTNRAKKQVKYNLDSESDNDEDDDRNDNNDNDNDDDDASFGFQNGTKETPPKSSPPPPPLPKSKEEEELDWQIERSFVLSEAPKKSDATAPNKPDAMASKKPEATVPKKPEATAPPKKRPKKLVDSDDDDDDEFAFKGDSSDDDFDFEETKKKKAKKTTSESKPKPKPAPKKTTLASDSEDDIVVVADKEDKDSDFEESAKKKPKTASAKAPKATTAKKDATDVDGSDEKKKPAATKKAPTKSAAAAEPTKKPKAAPSKKPPVKKRKSYEFDSDEEEDDFDDDSDFSDDSEYGAASKKKKAPAKKTAPAKKKSALSDDDDFSLD